MQALLKKLRLSQAILLVSMIPLVVMLGTFFASLGDLNERWRDAKVAVEISYINDLLGEIVHYHAVERGLTAGFIGSGGKRFGDELKQARLKSDEAEVHLKALTSDDFDALEFSQMQKWLVSLNQSLQKKAALREKVDQLDSGREAFGLFTKINADALDAIEMMTIGIKDTELGRKARNLLAID